MSTKDHAKCRSLLVSLSDYVDGELSDALCQEIERHMAECEDCRIVIDTLRKTISLYRGSAADPIELSDATRQHLYQALHLEEYLK